MKPRAARWNKGWLAFLIWVGIAPVACPDVIYQTYTPGAGGIVDGIPIYRLPTGDAHRLATSFNPLQDYSLMAATLNLNLLSGMSEHFQLTLRSDASGAPGSILTTFNNPGSIAEPDDYTFTTAGVPIIGGQTYWLVASPNLTADSLFVWNTVSGAEPAANSAYNTALGAWDSWSPLALTAMAYQISGNPIPEPGSLALLLTAGMLLLRTRFRRF
jgi:hypothetical protein